MPQFSVKRLLASMTLLAVGIGIDVWCVNYAPSATWREFQDAVAFWLVGGAMIGAGALAPFKWALIGAVVGFLIQGILAVGLIVSLARLNGI